MINFNFLSDKSMKRYIGISLLFISFLSWSQGTIRESLSMESEILGKKVAYSLYLPYDYESSSRSYPVLYLLHGYTDDETGWTQFGEVKTIADNEIGNSEVTPMIIAMPDGGLDWYVNSHDGKTMYEDFFIKEFIPHVETTFRARATKRYRAIAGLSMGGHGTLLYALKYPNMFSSAAPLSAAVWGKEWVLSNDQKSWDQYFGFIFGELEGEDRITDHLKSSMPLFIIRDAEADPLKTVKWYIDCGDDDFLIEGNMELHKIMREMEIPHEFRVRDGAHNWTYWRTALPEVLKFVSIGFHQ